MRPIRRIIIHCTASDDDPSLNFDNIRDYHTRDRGWSDIGYHAVIEVVDGVAVTVLGRPWHVQGAHAAGHNHDTLGFAVVHDGEGEVPPSLWNELLFRVCDACIQYGIPANNVIGHRELPGVTKACPGKRFDMERFRTAVRAVLR